MRRLPKSSTGSPSRGTVPNDGQPKTFDSDGCMSDVLRGVVFGSHKICEWGNNLGRTAIGILRLISAVGPSAGYAIVAAGNSNRIAGNQIEHATYGVLFDVGSANNIAYQNVLRDIPNVIVDLGSNQWQAAVGVTSAPNAWANIAY